ncbi:phosphoglycerate dehydrogenase, partial [Moniliophthora roreri]
MQQTSFVLTSYGWSKGRGSWSNTSRPALAIFPLLRASIKASSFTRGPREVFIRSALGFIRLKSSG